MTAIGGDHMTGADLRAMRARQLKTGRQIAAAFGVPDHLVGLETGPVRRWWQSHVTRRPDRPPIQLGWGRLVRRTWRGARLRFVPDLAGTLAAGTVGIVLSLLLSLAVKGWL